MRLCFVTALLPKLQISCLIHSLTNSLLGSLLLFRYRVRENLLWPLQCHLWDTSPDRHHLLAGGRSCLSIRPGQHTHKQVLMFHLGLVGFAGGTGGVLEVKVSSYKIDCSHSHFFSSLLLMFPYIFV